MEYIFWKLKTNSVRIVKYQFFCVGRRNINKKMDSDNTHQRPGQARPWWRHRIEKEPRKRESRNCGSRNTQRPTGTSGNTPQKDDRHWNPWESWCPTRLWSRILTTTTDPQDHCCHKVEQCRTRVIVGSGRSKKKKKKGKGTRILYVLWCCDWGEDSNSKQVS